MATTNYGWTLPTVGADTDNWGADLNADLVSIDAQVYNNVHGPAFAAYAASNQAISSATFTKVTLGTEIYDTNSNFASSRFTPTTAGYYQINGTIRGVDTVGISVFAVILYKNGAGYMGGAQTSVVTGTTEALSTSAVIYLNGTTDYVELFGFITGTSPSFDFQSAIFTSHMSGALIRAG
jgi:hypothetical protein